MYQQIGRTLTEAPASRLVEKDRLGARRERLESALQAVRRYLLAQQHPDGHWCAELEGDTILESEYILCLYFLGLAEETKVSKAANYLRRAQLPAGGWPNYPGGPADVSVSVKAYLVLKLAGDDPQAPHMVTARDSIHALGGLDAINSFTKLYLSIFGQYEWSRCPAVIPEMILLPRWFYFNIYAMSSWSRAIVVPLSMIWAHKPVCELPPRADLSELRLANAPPAPAETGDLKDRLWGAFFRTVDRGLRLGEALRLRPWRRRSMRRAEAWTLERLERSDGLGAIFPPIVNTLIALRCQGYALDHPVMRGQLHELEKLEIEEGDTLRIQPCKSPVWDTAITLDALLKSGSSTEEPEILAAARWLLEHEAREPGDCSILHPEIPVGGWYFEYANEFYPDCDDTAEVLFGLAQVRFPDPAEDVRRLEAIDRGRQWLLAMQNDDGGWGAFDKGCDRQILSYIPFADHNAMIDPSTSDVTSRSLEALVGVGSSVTSREVRRAAAFLSAEQEEDGTWYGRWGCNYLYGTWLAVQALRRAEVAFDDERLTRAARWLRSCQNEDGGWGELPGSYDDPSTKGQGPSTASQTAWALMGLFAIGDYESLSVRRGIDYLLETQQPEGHWHDEPWTGTGFPKVFYLRYHLYATYFPLQALSAYEKHWHPEASVRG
ncbi:MAG: squalene--hopene cyclase [Acidobacteriota bacterium]